MKFPKFAALLLGMIMTVTSAHAQTFPNRQVRIIIPYATGGGATIVTRGLQQGLSEALKVSVLMENKAGGATLVGTSEVARSAPDGYTLLMIPPLAWVGYYYSKTYETKIWEEMTPIAQFAEVAKIQKTAAGATPALQRTQGGASVRESPLRFFQNRPDKIPLPADKILDLTEIVRN